MKHFYELTKEDIKAMKESKMVVYRETEDNISIELFKPVDDKKTNDLYTFDGREMRYIIKWENENYTKHEACHVESFAQSVRTFGHVLKAGDNIRLEWFKDGGNSKLTDEAGLHVDLLDLKVIRKGRGAKNIALEFPIARVIAKNNSARMIQL